MFRGCSLGTLVSKYLTLLSFTRASHISHASYKQRCWYTPASSPPPPHISLQKTSNAKNTIHYTTSPYITKQLYNNYTLHFLKSYKYVTEEPFFPTLLCQILKPGTTPYIAMSTQVIYLSPDMNP